MADDARTIYLSGLRNAHALEAQALEMMERQVERYEHYPELKQKLVNHIQETHEQRGRLERILERHGDSPSSFKEMVTSVMGNVAAIGHAMSSDEILKNSFASFAFENYEIASYKSLIAMAEAAGDQQAVGELQRTLREEEEMARFIDNNMRMITERYIQREQAGMQAAN